MKIGADEIERVMLAAYREMAIERMIINDARYVRCPRLELEGIVARNSVKHIKPSGKFECEEYGLTLLANIRNDPLLADLAHNLCIGMAGGRQLAGLTQGPHLRLLAITTDDGLVEIEPQNDAVYNADPDTFSAFNLWM
jgi:hypothetical protein